LFSGELLCTLISEARTIIRCINCGGDLRLDADTSIFLTLLFKGFLGPIERAGILITNTPDRGFDTVLQHIPSGRRAEIEAREADRQATRLISDRKHTTGIECHAPTEQHNAQADNGQKISDH
jgi:hypothetical protein